MALCAPANITTRMHLVRASVIVCSSDVRSYHIVKTFKKEEVVHAGSHRKGGKGDVLLGEVKRATNKIYYNIIKHILI